MAVFTGTAKEFYEFIGPRTSDLVTKIARPHRKKKSCREIKEDNKPCGKWRYLDAAHLKGRERIILIQEILDDKGKKVDNVTYEINLQEFEKAFVQKHDSFFDVVNFMCRQHHKSYDTKNKIKTDENDLVAMEGEAMPLEVGISIVKDAKIVKAQLMAKYDYLNNGDCSIASLHHDNWNFNLKKETKHGHLICLNQFDKSAVILFYNFESTDVKLNLKKDQKQISLNIPFDDSVFKEIKLGEVFEFIEGIDLE